MQLDARALAAATADIVRKHVDEATGPLLRRIEELEARQPDKGDLGERGEAGPSGRDGSDGKDGVGLAAALINRDGELVVTTTDGQIRELGLVVGRDGRDGVDGKDGLPGRDGQAGERGEKGEDGTAGRDGKDAYPGEARGLFDPAAEYLARDIVALNGSAFMARRDNPGECPGDGWMLLASRGKRGERGETGERGPEGKSGKDGAQPIALKFDADTMQFITVLDSGEMLEADFGPIADKIIEALKGE
jgi:hypothetical protein